MRPLPEPAANPARLKSTESSFSDEALLLTDAPVPGMAREQQARKQEEVKLWVESLSDPRHLANLSTEWQELADQSAEPNPFYEPWVLLPALQHFGRGRVEVLLAFAPHPSRVKGKRLLCGLMPVTQRRGRLELWRHPYCYLGAPLLRRGFERRCLASFLDALAARTQVVRLEDVPGDGPVRGHLVDELNERGWQHLVSASYTRAVLKRAPSAEDFLARAVPGKRRKEWRRQRSRLGEAGRLTTHELSPDEDPRRFVQEFCALEGAGWKGREGVDAARDLAFIEELSAGAARGGKQQLLALRLDEKAVALKWNLFAGDAGFAFKITFDESFARFSPGVQLELDNGERAHQLPRLRWMDSCAAANRFMINHLWPDRREMQTIFFSTGRPLGAITVAAVPLLHFVRRFARRSP